MTDLMDADIDEFFTGESYQEFLDKEKSRRPICDKRLRGKDENFFDALLSVDMKNDPDGKKVIEIIKAL